MIFYLGYDAYDTVFKAIHMMIMYVNNRVSKLEILDFIQRKVETKRMVYI